MIQDIAPKQLHNQYFDRIPERGDKILAYQNKAVFLNESFNKIRFLTYGELCDAYEKQGKSVPPCQYLFSIDEDMYFLTALDETIKFEGFSYQRLIQVRPMYPKDYVMAAATGWHLCLWYRSNQFCGCCGHKLVHDKKERMLSCPQCGNLVFPKIAPAIIVGVTDGDKILMTKYAGREYKRYALIAGFTEIGETAEETVKREVMEEVGLHVKNITYYKSQPWGFDSNLLLGFFAEVDDTKSITLDTKELSLAEWVDWKDVPDDYEKISITNEMMQLFKDKKRKEWEEKHQ